MEVRPGYKLTEVGLIPQEWAAPRLDSLGAGAIPPIKAGPFGSSLTKDQYVPYGFKVYGQEQVIRGDHLFGDYFISAVKYRELESCAVRPGDVLLSLVGTAGKLLEVPDDAPLGVINPRLVRFSFDRNKVLSRFFRYQFESDTVQSQLSRQAQGGTMGVLNAGVLRPFRIPLPPMPEQRAIGKALSDMDALLGGLDRLIAKKRDLKQAAMQQLLTGQTRLPGFRGDWEVKRLAELFRFSGGYSAARDQLSAEGHCYLHYGDIHGSSKTTVDTRADFQDIPKLAIALNRVSRDSLLEDGDVVFVDASEDDTGTSRHLVVVNKDGKPFISGLHTIVAKSKTQELTHEYRRYCFKTEAIRQQFLFYAVGTKVSGISKTNIPKLTLPVPSVSEQTAIAAVLSDIDAELSALEARRDKTRALKQGMMQELLTGRTRLVRHEHESAAAC
jgi:type I restriction enzyme, S subunit